MSKEAPIHAKLRKLKAEGATAEALAAILAEHHKDLPPAFVWAEHLVDVVVSLSERVAALEERAR